MLRNRSRAVTSKQALMADPISLHSPTKSPKSPVSSFLNSPRFFNGLLSKNNFSEAETSLMTPTSILDTKCSSNFLNPFGYNSTKPKFPIHENNSNKLSNKLEPHPVGLALIDSIIDEKDDNFCKPVNRMVLLGSKLKVQIPPFNSPFQISPVESPKSPADFGIKTRNLMSPFVGTSENKFTRQLSLKEMELSEDYTCVIIHGPNPKTTHIFDNCIVENCIENGTEFLDHEKIKCDLESNVQNSEPMNFLSFCHTCKDRLEDGKDIFMYRGEKAFCSEECRSQEIHFKMKNQYMDDAF